MQRRDASPNVLLLTTDASGVGGVQRASRTLARALVDLYGSRRVNSLSVWGPIEGLPGRISYGGRPRKGERVGIGGRAMFVGAAVRAAVRMRGEPGRIVACHPHLGLVAYLAHLISRAPYLVWCHGEEVWGRLRWSVEWSLRRADAVFAPSDFTAGRVEATASLPRRSVVVVPHCLPPDMEHLLATAAPSAEATVVTVARLVPQHAYKGIDVLIQTWPRVLDRVPSARLVVVGDGGDRPRLVALAASLGISDAVAFAGAVTDEGLSRCLRSSRVFSLPARTRVAPRPEGEGFGLVYLEASAAGLPVVAVRSGAIPEVVFDGETGLLVPEGDEAALADALVELLTDDELRHRLGDNGRRTVTERFGYELFRERVRELVELSSSKRRS